MSRRRQHVVAPPRAMEEASSQMEASSVPSASASASSSSSYLTAASTSGVSSSTMPSLVSVRDSNTGEPVGGPIKVAMYPQQVAYAPAAHRPSVNIPAARQAVRPEDCVFVTQTRVIEFSKQFKVLYFFVKIVGLTICPPQKKARVARFQQIGADRFPEHGRTTKTRMRPGSLDVRSVARTQTAVPDPVQGFPVVGREHDTGTVVRGQGRFS
jgi:hypothetical protein